MQRHASVHGESTKPFFDQCGVEWPDFGPHEFNVEYQEWPTGNIESDARERFVHRHVHIGIAGDALHLGKRLLDRLAERDANIFGRVVVIDVQIALGSNADVNSRMPGQQIEHVVEKADASFDRRRAGPIEVDGDLDIGFLSLARHRAFAHFTLPTAVSGSILPSRGPFIRADPNSPLAPSRICIGPGQLLNHGLSKRFPAWSVESWPSNRIYRSSSACHR